MAAINTRPYFSHDANARNDLKIKALRKKYKSAGYGDYWVIVELLRETAEYKLPLDEITYEAIADETNQDAGYVEEFIKDCINKYKLFDANKDFFWSNSLIARMKIATDKHTRAVNTGKLGAEIKAQKAAEKEQTRYPGNIHDEPERKGIRTEGTQNCYPGNIHKD